MTSHVQELYLVSQDFLQLLGKKQKQAEVSKEVEKEFETLQSFWEVVVNIITRSEMEQHTERVKGINQHVMCKILEAELKKTYNELHKRGQVDLLTLLATTTPVLSKKELEQITVLR